jgi:hypothetical protein
LGYGSRSGFTWICPNEQAALVDPLVDWKSAIGQLGDRLEGDYLDRVKKFARGFGIWGGSTVIGYEIPLGGRIGKMVGNRARYAKRSGLFGLFGRRELVRDLADIESQFRREIEAWLNEQEIATPNRGR